jgi:sulfur carrier protein
MISLQVNGETKTLNSECSVTDALNSWGYQSKDIAVAINGEFVARTLYAQQSLKQNDLVDIVTPIQGG